MASRGKKKKVEVLAVSTPQSSEERDRMERNATLNTRYNLIIVTFIILFVIAICIPLTGVSFSIMPSELVGGGETASAMPPQQQGGVSNGANEGEKPIVLGFSLGTLSIIFAPKLGEEFLWSNYLINNIMPKSGGMMSDATNAIAHEIASRKITSAQLVLLEKAFWVIFAISILTIVIWIALSITAIIVRKYKKSVLPIIILTAIMLVVNVFEFFLLVTLFFNGSAGASFVVNVASYLMPILSIAFLTCSILYYNRNKDYMKFLNKVK
ncbi:MAG: hypothetical protein RR348_06290 [Clostridia bacterium]